jgi:hypothetical protein
MQVSLEDQKAWGIAYRIPHTQKFTISIRSALQCVNLRLFVLFHEIGHVKLGHLEGYRRLHCDQDIKEEEADRWAFGTMKMTDPICKKCAIFRSKICLKGHVF